MKHCIGIISLLLLFICTTEARAEESAKIGSGDKRSMNYYPVDGDFVTVNGKNRYTRALYGTQTQFRLETSDAPIFAIYNKKNNCNISFTLIRQDGKVIPLEEVTYCKSMYGKGNRRYIIRDSRIGAAQINLCAVTLSDMNGALWIIDNKNLGKAKLVCTVTDVRNTRLSRNGDMGVDLINSFDRSLNPKYLLSDTLELNNRRSAISVVTADNGYRIVKYKGDISKGKRLDDKFINETLNIKEKLSQSLSISTPDKFLNPIGSALSLAADAIWDGKVWLHGAVGWRMPLNGWRAAYTGDFIGWHDRARTHFNAYALSQVDTIAPTISHPSQDKSLNMARAEKRWGTQMYSNGYICRNPENKRQMHHYDMNLCYIDELLWHLNWTGDIEYAKKMWPTIKRHIEWEKRNFDPDNDALYDAYCCIWASDALYYNSGAVTHSSAYNYRGNKLAARIAEIIGEDPTPYNKEADAILAAMNQRLWLNDEGHWAEFQDFMGKKRLHKSAALWTIYTPIDCGACTPEQAYQATVYVDKNIPHIPVLTEPQPQDTLYTLSTSDWMPYDWSTNNVAQEEVSNMALAYFQAGRTQSGYNLLKAEMMDAMYLGQCPGNFGQISYLDKSRSEAYRDFGDGIGIFSRTLINGLFGINPQALYGKCILKPAFPESWDSASIRTPYLSYEFHRQGNLDIYHIRHHFTRPLQMLVQANAGGGAYLEVKGNSDEEQTITIDRNQLPKSKTYPGIPSHKANVNVKEYLTRMGLDEPSKDGTRTEVKMDKYFNANVDDIFKNKYLSPRSPYTTLEIPTQGVSEWCVPTKTAYIEDDGLRNKVTDGHYDTQLGITFRTPKEGPNIAYTSLWDNYPDSITIPLKGKARCAYLMMAGSTNNMQSRIDNGLVTATYMDGTTDTLHLENPINWCPIEQAYYVDGLSFWSAPVRPYRIDLLSGKTAREVNVTLQQGAAQLLKMPLTADKKLRSLTVHTLSNDVVIGLMGVTLER